MTDIRTLENLASFLHGYVIKARGEGNEPRRFRAVDLEGLVKTIEYGADPGHVSAILRQMRRTATELAGIDPSLSWLPDWKPRVATPALSSRGA